VTSNPALLHNARRTPLWNEANEHTKGKGNPEGIAADVELSGEIFTIECDGKVHVFDADI